jgi:hypothetical protein
MSDVRGERAKGMSQRSSKLKAPQYHLSELPGMQGKEGKRVRGRGKGELGKRIGEIEKRIDGGETCSECSVTL